VRSTATGLGPKPPFRESVAAVFLEPGGLVDVLGVDAGPDIGVNVADFGFHLIPGEALILCSSDHLVGQGPHGLPVSPRDELFVGVDAVSEPEIREFTRLGLRLPLDQAGAQSSQSPIDADGGAVISVFRSALRYSLYCFAHKTLLAPTGIGARGGSAVEIYLSELLIEVKLLLRVPPSKLTVAIIASAMPAAIRPYSIAVAPDSSDQNLEKRLN
jgi:hypothetical protein